jgi:hypothetical protein
LSLVRVSSFIIYTPDDYVLGYYPEYYDDMCTLVCIFTVAVVLLTIDTFSLQVYQEGSTFRSKLKDMARDIVKNHYSIFSGLEECDNQHEEAASIVNIVKKLLDDGFFLQNGKDANVSVSG